MLIFWWGISVLRTTSLNKINNGVAYASMTHAEVFLTLVELRCGACSRAYVCISDSIGVSLDFDLTPAELLYNPF